MSDGRARRVRWSCAVALAAALVVAPRVARADDGPVTALKNMVKASPTITIVTSTVVILVNTVLSGITYVDGARGVESDRSVAILEVAAGAPQAALFAAAPFFFDIGRWRPEENLLLLLPFTAWSGSLTAHGVWSLTSKSVDPGSRVGVSLLVGTNWAVTSAGLGCLSRGEPSPLEVAIVEAVVGTGELGFAIERIVHDADHRAGWGVLAGWSALILTHGILSTAIAVESGGDSSQAMATDDRPASPTSSPSWAPWVTPTVDGDAGGVVVGAIGLF